MWSPDRGSPLPPKKPHAKSANQWKTVMKRPTGTELRSSPKANQNICPAHAHWWAGSRQSSAAEETSRKVRKVREVINWWTLAAEASKNLENVATAPTCWIAAVSAAEEILSRKERREMDGETPVTDRISRSLHIRIHLLLCNGSLRTSLERGNAGLLTMFVLQRRF